jgi:hypothetical protein
MQATIFTAFVRHTVRLQIKNMAIAEMKQEWRRFKHDRPGERFNNHRRRMESKPHWQHVLRAVAGFGLIVLGIVFCFLPGPGLLGIVFGLALLAGMSTWLAGKLDRSEPRVRTWGHQRRREWRAMPKRTQAMLAATVGIVGGLIVFAMARAIL